MQDESRAKVFDIYATQLEKKIKENTNLSFLRGFQAEVDRFYHSGLATRKNKHNKLVEKNPIISVKIFPLYFSPYKLRLKNC